MRANEPKTSVLYDAAADLAGLFYALGLNWHFKASPYDLVGAPL